MHIEMNIFVILPQGRPLSFKTFLIWVLISIYQGKDADAALIMCVIARDNRGAVT